MRSLHVSVCLALALSPFVQAQSGVTAAFAQGSGVPSPAAHFGFELTADGNYAMWDQEVAYYEKLAKESDRIDLQVLGKSTLGRPFILLTISSPQNLAITIAICCGAAGSTARSTWPGCRRCSMWATARGASR